MEIIAKRVLSVNGSPEVFLILHLTISHGLTDVGRLRDLGLDLFVGYTAVTETFNRIVTVLAISFALRFRIVFAPRHAGGIIVGGRVFLRFFDATLGFRAALPQD